MIVPKSTVYLSMMTRQIRRLHINNKGSKQPIVRGVQRLEDADLIVGHNIIGFDIPVIRQFYPWFGDPPTVIDTLLLSRLFHPNMIEIDKKHEWMGCHLNYMEDILLKLMVID